MSFLGFFRRRPVAGAGPAGAVDPEGWQVGDQAECIVRGQWFLWPSMAPSDGPRQGQVLKVLAVTEVTNPLIHTGRDLTLSFGSFPGRIFSSACFRKVRPRADDASPAEEAFTELVRRTPAPAPAPVSLPDQPKIEEFQ